MKNESQLPPREWVDLLGEHDGNLERVRMLWRRGSGRYRPLVSWNVDLDDLEDQPLAEWEALELDEGHRRWEPGPDDETARDRKARLVRAAGEFWALARRWSEAKGPNMHFQLRGYGGQNEVLFEKGKQIDVSSASERVDGEPSRPTERDTDARQRERESRLEDDYQLLRRNLRELADNAVQERNWAIHTTQETTRVVPTLIASTGDILRDALGLQRESVDRLLEQQSGRKELEARAFEAKQRTARWHATLNTLGDAWQAGLAHLAPVVGQIFAARENRGMQSMPQFKVAQQAFAYLFHTLSDTQVHLFWPDPDFQRHFTTSLLEASKLEDERESIQRFGPLHKFFRTQKWVDIALPEQQIAARFIVGRAAMYRVVFEDPHVS